MPFPRKLLNADEEVVVDVRPHVWALVGPVLAAIVVVVGSAAAAVAGVPGAVSWVLVGLLVVVLSYLVVRYLRWRSTSLVVTNQRLVRRTGVLSRRGREIPLIQLADISYRQSLFGRLIGAGDLILESAGRDSVEVFAALPRPAMIQNEIYRLVSARSSASAPVEGGLSLPEQLERLDDLRRRGVISDAEFDSSKSRLLQR